MDVQRIAAFSLGTNGGNPAGVVLCEALPAADRMLAIAASLLRRLLAQRRRAEGQPRYPLLGVMRTSQALRAHRVITTDDDNSDM